MPDQTMRERVTDQTPTIEDVGRARFNVSGVHHIIGTECLCGARRLHKNRDRTEHILDAFIKELDLAVHDRAVKAEAWDEGAASQSRHHTEVYVAECNLSRYPKPPANPYRIDRIEAGRG